MLKHGRAGVPLEVMGLMLGDFVDEFTVRVIGEKLRSLVGDAASEGGTKRVVTGDAHAVFCLGLVCVKMCSLCLRMEL